VIVRSNGTVTYGRQGHGLPVLEVRLLGEDFHYRHFGEEGKDGPLWATSSQPDARGRSGAAAFGGGHTIFNVIDVRSRTCSASCRQALAAAGHPGEAERSIHFAYEMVALSASDREAARLLVGSEDAGRPFVEYPGARGSA